MSYAQSLALQKAVFARLDAAPDLTGRVHDVVPSGAIPDTWVMIGEDDVRDRSDKTGSASLHLFTVSVVTDTPGFAAAKTLAATVCDLLDGAAMPLERGRLTNLRFDRARARRTGSSGDLRRIDLRFAARLDDEDI